MKPETQENLMPRYLLGGLPEAEATALEEQLLADDERFERAREIENRLVDDYVRGRLSSEDRERFERHYLASPVHRRRVAFARNLITEADGSEAEVIAIEPKISWRARLSEKLRVSPVSWRFAQVAATLLLLAAAGLWLLLDRARLRRDYAQLRTENEVRQNREQVLTDQLAAARGEGENLAAELAQLRAAGDTLARQTTPALPTPPAVRQSPRPSVFAFLLSPTLVRGDGDPQTLTIPPKTDVARLRMRVEQNARRFQISVRTVEGREVWERQIIKPHTDGAGAAVVTADIPAGKLALGDYILTLSSVNPAGEPEEVARYFFRVIRR
jgi:hypothetical protein